jgi:hypothetical protein
MSSPLPTSKKTKIVINNKPNPKSKRRKNRLFKTIYFTILDSTAMIFQTMAY